MAPGRVFPWQTGQVTGQTKSDSKHLYGQRKIKELDVPCPDVGYQGHTLVPDLGKI